MNKIKLISVLLFPLQIFAQIPNTDIWLLDINEGNKIVKLSNPVNITNRTGYDNQPQFSPDGTYMIYTAIKEDNQADIFKYDLTNKNITQLTNTPTSEYSPTFMPDDKNISIVTVETDSAQRLWYIPIKGGTPQLLIPNVDSVGYHTWFDNNILFMFLLPEPFTLHLVDKKTGTTKLINDSVSRCFRKYGNVLLYAKKINAAKYEILKYKFPDHKSWTTNTFISGEDFAIYKDQLLWSSGSKIYITTISKNDHQELIDLSGNGIKKITRITVGPYKNKIAIAAE